MSGEIRALSRAEVRSIDARAERELGIPTLVLMENAGRGAADWLTARLRPGASVVVACGPGNNGGDGAVVARHLDGRGFDVRVVWLTPAESIRGDAAAQRRILDRSGIEQMHFEAPDAGSLDALWEGHDWVVDALLGTGLTRPVEGGLAAAVEAINRSGRPVLSLDLPSGLDADTGRPLGVAVRAAATATFVAPKLGFSRPGAPDYLGEVVVVDIGVPRMLLSYYANV